MILREIKFGGFGSAKSAILRHLGALIFYFNEYLHFLKAQICQINKIQCPKVPKMAVLEFLDFPKLISRKIKVIEKSCNFHNVL